MENEGGLDNVAYGCRCNILFLNCKQYFIPHCNKFIHVYICTLEAFYFFFSLPCEIITSDQKGNSILESLLVIPLVFLSYVSDILFFIPGLPAVIWRIGLVTISRKCISKFC